MRRLFLIILIVIFTTLSCSSPFKSSRGNQETGSRRFETVYVDPVIIYSDSLITLIRAERLDSLLITDEELIIKQPAVLEMVVERPSCQVSVSFSRRNRSKVHPLMFQSLPEGYYKLVFNSSRFNAEPLLPGEYQLKANLCGQEQAASFYLD